MLYNPPTGGASNDPYIGKNVAAGIQGSTIPPAAVEYPQREIVAVIDAAGMSRTNADLQQMLKAIRSGKLNYFDDGGTADAMLITPSPVYTDLSEGTEFTILKGANPNATTTPTLTVNGLTLPLVKEDGSALAIGDLRGLAPITVRSDGTKFRVRGLRFSDTSDFGVHRGDDSSGSAGTITATVTPAITAYATDTVYVIGVGHACTGATNANLNGKGNRALKRFDGTNLQAGDWAAFDRLVLVDDGTVLRVMPTIPMILSMVAGSTLVSTTINLLTPNGATRLPLAFTAGAVVTDVAVAPSFTTVQTSDIFTGATYIDASATCAIYDNATSGTVGGATARIQLNDITAGTSVQSEYVGGGSTSQGTQVSLVDPRFIYTLDPTHFYSLSLVCQKGAGAGASQIFDAYIFGLHNGTNS